MSEKAKNSKLKALDEKIRLRPGSAAMFLAEMLSAQATARGPR
jgi:hypothetical protein